MMKRVLGLVFILGIALGSSKTSADGAISLTVRPSVATFRGNATLKVLVARDEKNRALTWEVDGPHYYRSSSMDLAGASAPRSYFFMVRELPAGEFEVRATVRRNDNSVVIDRGTIRVVGGPE